MADPHALGGAGLPTEARSVPGTHDHFFARLDGHALHYPHQAAEDEWSLKCPAPQNPLSLLSESNSRARLWRTRPNARIRREELGGCLDRCHHHPIGAHHTHHESAFAKRAFAPAGIFGILVLVTQLFVELGAESKPLARSEIHYGFVGLALVWQVAFLVITSDVRRMRPVMPLAVLEKASFGIPAVWLFALGRVPVTVLKAGCVDLALGALFFAAHRSLREPGIED